MLTVPVALIAGAVFVTANVQRNAALLSAREQAASQSLLTAMLDQETGARGFFQTGRRLFLAPWTQGTGAFASSLAELRLLLGGDTPLQRSLAEQARIATAWHVGTRAAILALEQHGRGQPIAAAVRAKTVMDSFRRANASFDASLSRERSQSLSTATDVAVAVAVALAALLAGVGLLLAHRMARREQTRQRDQAQMRHLLQASDSEHESRDLLVHHVEKLLPNVGAAVLSCNDSDSRLEITKGARVSPLHDFETERLPARACMAVRLSHPYDRHPGDRHGLQSCEICGGIDGITICEPLRVGGAVIGAVLVASSKAIDAQSRARLRDSVAQAAPILANQRNLAAAERRATSDALTGLPNRRAADETFVWMAAQAARSASPLAAILLDLDHFKGLNDRQGHESGDRALSLVGGIIEATIRRSDFAARFGGEEFLVLLPDTDREAAVLVAEKLRSAIEQAELVGIGHITASLGLAVLPMDAEEPGELLRKADRALYAAKDSGRNQLHVFSHPVTAS